MNQLPIISLANLKSRQSTQEHRKLYDVCIDHGFFYLKDHGISTNLIRQTIEASRAFFNLPADIKLQYSHAQQKVYPPTSRGYVPMYRETLHNDVGPDPKEFFDLGLDRPISQDPFTGPNVAPEDKVAPRFLSSHYQLQADVMNQVVPVLLNAFALALDLPIDWFSQHFQEPILIHRTIYYPPNQGVAGRHTDNGIFTVLIQEQFANPSLRVYAKQSWIDAACLDDAFVINLGDMLQTWTSGLFVSTPHEVIHSLPVSRISIPFFIYPNIETLIRPIASQETISSLDIMLKNFSSIWVSKTGAGRAQELA